MNKGVSPWFWLPVVVATLGIFVGVLVISPPRKRR
jgi:hypothetical protein